MDIAQTTKQLLEKYGLRANRVLGQNFLINEGALSALLAGAEITKTDTVVEVGPGLGTITRHLAETAGRVIAVEKDPAMVEVLREELSDYKNIEIIQEDILKFDPATYQLRAGGYTLVGAPPYYLTARLFRAFLEGSSTTPSRIAFIIQEEVAEKVVATPPRANMLAVSVQLYGTPAIKLRVGRSSFLPQPAVDSALLVVANIQKPSISEKIFFATLRAGFSSPRKQLGVNFANAFHAPRATTDAWLTKNGIDPTRRAQTLSVGEWNNLATNEFVPQS